MNEQIIESVANSQNLTMVAVGVFGCLFIIDRVYTILQKRNGKGTPPPVVPTELLRETVAGMAGLAKTIDGIERDLAQIREHLHTVKETVTLIDARQRDRDR